MCDLPFSVAVFQHGIDLRLQLCDTLNESEECRHAYCKHSMILDQNWESTVCDVCVYDVGVYTMCEGVCVCVYDVGGVHRKQNTKNTNTV